MDQSIHPTTCRVLPFAESDGPGNMAADQTLLETATSGVASLRFYGWTMATLSLGYFQPAALRLADPHLSQLPFVRRPTGGEALVHDHELTYALALPAGSPWQRRGESWLQRMHGIIRTALQQLGVSVSACGCGDEGRLGPVLCFLHHTPCDLLLGRHKVVGSAQRKSRGALLQHGAILLAQSPHTPFLPGLRDLVGFDAIAASRDHLFRTLLTEFRRDTGWTLRPANWTRHEWQRAAELAVERFSSPLWNEKR
jgi:lipoate-protein ligase A